MSIKIIFFREESGKVPLLEWLDNLPEKALGKCLNRIDRLKEQGHLLRRPESDFLRDGIYELRVRYLHVNYRMLYFFHGQTAAIISHGLVKESQVPGREIDKAIERMLRFKNNLSRYSAEG